MINWGVQFHTAAGKVLGLLANYTAATVRAAADRPPRARPLIIWRETAPQHFPGGNGNFGTVKSWWATTNASCLPTEHPYRGYNELTSPIVRAAGIPILPVWEPSLPHHRAHVGWKPLRGGRTLDCTHFCLASGLLDHWVELLIVNNSLKGVRGKVFVKSSGIIIANCSAFSLPFSRKLPGAPTRRSRWVVHCNRVQ